MNFITELENNEKSYTENGSIGYTTTEHRLVDLNFKVPSYRDKIDSDLFDKALAEDKSLTLKWLLYLRDIRNGIGERKSFREFVKYLCNSHEDLAFKFISSVDIAEYGRYDDYVWLYVNINSSKIKNEIKDIIYDQIKTDIINMHEHNNVSLAAKWLPSENASSKETKIIARIVRKEIFNMTSKDYRKTLSSLRSYIDVVEVKMSNNEWEDIDYCKVPSKANLMYGTAFYKHDAERREEYLYNLRNGTTKINAQAMFLHDIVHKYSNKYDIGWGWIKNDGYEVDDTLEALWNAQDKCNGFTNTLVVRDGSGSMYTCVPGSNVSAIDVTDALTLYCAENNEGQFHNKFITFSNRPKVIDVNGKDTLFDKLSFLREYDDCSNTNIEKVFKLILDTAVKAGMVQQDLPQTILIISDMEFDCQVSGKKDEVMFESFAKEYEANGYKLPKLVFWNVNSRTNTVPITKNDNGVILISGFSKNLMEMVMSSESDPYKALVKVLSTDRYSCVDKVFE